MEEVFTLEQRKAEEQLEKMQKIYVDMKEEKKSMLWAQLMLDDYYKKLTRANVVNKQQEADKKRMDKKVRGLRICQEETCKLPQNRDRTGASNIGMQFNRLFEGKPPIRQMNEEEKEFHRLRLVCEPCATS